MSVHRLPDGSTVFLCGRGASSATPDDKMRAWIADEARSQGRCGSCMEKIGQGCPAERASLCRNPAKTGAAAVAILKGMVAG